jgi:hypothetical protein
VLKLETGPGYLKCSLIIISPFVLGIDHEHAWDSQKAVVAASLAPLIDQGDRMGLWKKSPKMWPNTKLFSVEISSQKVWPSHVIFEKLAQSKQLPNMYLGKTLPNLVTLPLLLLICIGSSLIVKTTV